MIEADGFFCNAPTPQITTIYKFGGSSVASAERMLEVADIVCSFPEDFPCIVLSAMGKVLEEVGLNLIEQFDGLLRKSLAVYSNFVPSFFQTTNMLLEAGTLALECSPEDIQSQEPYRLYLFEAVL